MAIEKIEAVIEVEVDKASLTKSENDIEKSLDNVRADIKWFQERIKTDTAVQLSLESWKLKIQLDWLKKDLKEATTPDAKIEIQSNIDRISLQLTQARKELRNFANTWQKDVSVLWKLFNNVTNEISKSRLELLKLWKSTKILDKLEKEADQLSKSLKEWKINAQQFGVSMTKLNLQAQTVTKWIWGIWNTLKNVVKGFIAFRAIQWVRDGLLSVVRTSLTFESAFAWIRKTIDASESEFRGIEKSLIDLSKRIPITVKELAGIAEVWGQLWVSAGDILKFTEVVAQIWVSTNLTAEEAATAFARISAVTWEPISNIDKMASSVVWLGNSFATTEKEILTFATRISWAWKIAWLTSADIFWISAWFSAVWIAAEAWWTQVQKALLEIDKAVTRWWDTLDWFAELTWNTAEEFGRKWKDDAWQTFIDFISALWKSWKEWVNILWKLIWENERTTRAFLTAAGAWDLLQRSLDKANEEYKNNNALTIEATKRFKTNASQLAILTNKWTAFWNEIGSVLIEAILPVLKWITGVIQVMKDWSRVIWFLTIAIVALAGAKGLQLLLISLKGIIPKLKWMTIANGLLTASTKLSTTSIRALIVSLAGLQLAIFPLIAVVTALGIAFGVYNEAVNLSNNNKAAIKSANNLSETLNRATNERKKNIQDLQDQNRKLANSDDENAKKRIAINEKLIKSEQVFLSAILLSGWEQIKWSQKLALQKFQESRDLKKSAEQEAESIWGLWKQTIVTSTTLKTLRDGIKSLQWELESVWVETEEFKDIQKELAEQQKLLSQALWKDQIKQAKKTNAELKSLAKKREKEEQDRLKRGNKRLQDRLDFEVELAETAQDEIDDAVKESEKTIKDYQKEILKVWASFTKVKRKALNEVSSINNELSKLWEDRWEDIWERQLEILEEREELLEKIAEATKDSSRFAWLQSRLEGKDAQLDRSLSVGKRKRLEEERLKILEQIEEKLLKEKRLTDEQTELVDESNKLTTEQEIVTKNISDVWLDEAKRKKDLSPIEKILEEKEAEKQKLESKKQDILDELKALKDKSEKEIEILKAKTEAEKVLIIELWVLRVKTEEFVTKRLSDEVNKQITLTDKVIKRVQKLIDLKRQAWLQINEVETNVNTWLTSGQNNAWNTNNTNNTSTNIEVNVNATINNDTDINALWDILANKIDQAKKWVNT